MRVLYKIVVLMLTIIISATSCSSNEDVIPTITLLSEEAASLNNASLIFDSIGQSRRVLIKSNTQWKIECQAEWVHCKPVEGSGDSIITISADSTDISRSAVMVAFIDSAPQIRQIINIIQHSSPSDPTNEEQDNTSDEEPTDGNTEEESENESSKEESDGSNEQPDDSSGNENDTEGESDDGNDNDSDGNPDEDTDEEIDNTTDEEPALPDSSHGVTLAQLSEGEYYIGGYKADVLYLATDIISSGHLHTTPYAYIAESDSLSPLSNTEATTITLEPTTQANCYYILFSEKGYLQATEAKAGKLTFSTSSKSAWLFSQLSDGLLAEQQGEIKAKLICSEHAPDRLLRSMSSENEDEGGAIVLFRKR